VVVGLTLAENKLISLFLLKYLWSECERVRKPYRQWAAKGVGKNSP